MKPFFAVCLLAMVAAASAACNASALRWDVDRCLAGASPNTTRQCACVQTYVTELDQCPELADVCEASVTNYSAMVADWAGGCDVKCTPPVPWVLDAMGRFVEEFCQPQIFEEGFTAVALVGYAPCFEDVVVMGPVHLTCILFVLWRMLRIRSVWKYGRRGVLRRTRRQGASEGPRVLHKTVVQRHPGASPRRQRAWECCASPPPPPPPPALKPRTNTPTSLAQAQRS